MRLLIAIPVYNERKYVRHVLARVKAFHADVLVIDDGSTDGTGDVLAEMAGAGEIRLLRHPINRGYGQSLIDAFKYADRHGFDWVLTMDCDEQHEPERIPDFVREIRTDQWDVISGSRYLAPRQEDDLPPGDRRTINATITATLNELFGWNLTDSFCGFKAHRVSAMRKLALTETGYAFPLQLWPQIYEHGLRVTEIPVRLIYNDPTRHFGGILDDAAVRLQHYTDVLNSELRRMSHAGAPAPETTSCDQPAICNCFCGE
ncbi:MAG: glycosyltransferase family 2 protein [Phycisphaerae bacterium]|nr:glycosyltransferase family 2 protein [Tepidisphaeraceae bacterium]